MAESSLLGASAEVGTVPAALGLRTTAADLIRFALGWSTLLPGVAGQAGYARSAAASLVVKLDSGKVHVALTNRGIPIEEVNGRVVHALADS
jgi:hypothetical protein